MSELKNVSPIKKTIAIVGIGNCGSQIASLANKKYPDIFDTICMNTSDADLSMTGNTTLKLKIGDDTVEGSAKNRTKMKNYLHADIKKLLENDDLKSIIGEKKYVFIISSAAGGTGSGAAPVMLDIFREYFVGVHFILVGVLPHMRASLMEQGNLLEYLNELYNILSDDKTTYMLYDNETTSDLSPTQSLEVVNDNIVEDLRVLSGVDNHPTKYESIDPADMESIYTTPGRLIVVRITKGLTEKVLEDTAIDDIILKAIKTSKHTEINRDRKSGRWGIITYFTENVNNIYRPSLEKLQALIGVPDETMHHNAINTNDEGMNYMYFIASGLAPINDRVAKTEERINQLKASLESRGDTKYIMAESDVSYNVMEARKAEEAKKEFKEKEGGISINNIFNKFK